jgi:AcrR family transcriptional regulator
MADPRLKRPSPPARRAGKPAAARPNGAEEKLRRAAEKLFTRHGFRAVSVRRIAAEAGVNSALVGYYFRGKDNLFAEVFRTYGKRINDRRQALLAAVTVGGRQASVREIMEAYLQPVFDLGNGGKSSVAFLQLSSVLAAERMDLYETIATEVFSAVNADFVERLHACLPGIDKETLSWRLFAVVGAGLFVTMKPFPPAMAAILPRGTPPRDADAIMAAVLPFCVEGMAAPASPAKPASARRRAR